MSMIAELPNGDRLEFPDGTDPSVVQRVVKQRLGISVETPEETSASKAFGKSAVESIAPTMTGLAAAGRGATAGAALMPPVLPLVGPLSKPIGGLIGGVAGGIAGGLAGQTAQDAITQYIPDSIKEQLGFGEQQRKLEHEQHPVASIAGELAPSLAAFRPGSVSKLERLGGATLMGGVETGMELANGELDPTRIAMNVALGLAAPKQTRFGAKLMGHTAPEKGSARDGLPTEDAPNIDKMAQEQLQHSQRMLSKVEKDLYYEERKSVKNEAKIEQLKADKKLHEENIIRYQEAIKPPINQGDVPQSEYDALQQTAEQQPQAKRPLVDQFQRINETKRELAKVEQFGKDLDLGDKTDPQTQAYFAAKERLETRLNHLAEEFDRLKQDLHDQHIQHRVENGDWEAPIGTELNQRPALEYLPENQHVVGNDIQVETKPEFRVVEPTQMPTDAPQIDSLIHTPSEIPEHVLETVPDSAYYELNTALEKPQTQQAPKFEIDNGKHAAERSQQNSTVDWELRARENPAQLERDIEGFKLRLEQWKGTQAEPYIKADLLRAKSALDKVNRSVESEPVTQLTPKIAEKVVSNDVKGALDIVATQSPVKSLRILASALSGNRSVTGKGKVGFNFKQENVAQHNQLSQDITFNNLHNAGPITLIHEVIHRATATIIDRFKAGLLTNGVQKVAAKNIIDLYKHITGQKRAVLNKLFAKAEGDIDKLSVMLENEKEFISYGTTDPRLVEALSRLKIGKQSSFQKLADYLSEALGFKPNERNAYQELLENTLKLSEHSDVPNALTGGVNKIAFKVDTGEIKTGFRTLGRHGVMKMFTDQIPYLFNNNPAVKDFSAKVTMAENAKTQVVNRIMHGDVPKDYNGVRVYNAPDSLVSIAQKMKPVEMLDAHSGMIDVYASTRHVVGENKQQMKARYDVEFDKLKATLSPEQAVFVDQMRGAANRLIQYANDMYASFNINHHVTEDVAYTLINRSGKHGVMVSINGAPLHFERFVSDVEANKFIKKVEQMGDTRLTVEKVKRDNAEDVFSSVQDTLLYALKEAQQTGESAQTIIIRKLNELTGTTKAIGGHLEQRTGVTGYAGTEWFMSKEQSAKRFVDSIQNSVGEYAEQVRRRALTLAAARIAEDNPMTPEQYDVFTTYVKSMVNSRSDLSFVKDLDNAVVEFVQRFGSALGTKSDQTYIDAAFRKMNAFTHISKLALSPAQWLAQAMSFTAGTRDLFNKAMTWNGKTVNQNNNPIQALASMGKGMLDYGKFITKNYHAIEPDLLAAIKWASQDTEIFHPHISDAMVKKANLSDRGKLVDNSLDVLLAGNSFADSHSRVLAFMTYYHNIKGNSSLTGKDLWSLAGKMTDDNLLLMGERHQPLLYGELGMIGKAISPLKTYAHGFSGRLAGDVKDAIVNRDVNSTLRLCATALASVMAGGVINATITADYDWLMEHLGMPEAKVSKWAMETLPDYANYGLVTAATQAFGDGIDIGASLRYRSVFDLLDLGNSASLSITGKAIKGAWTIGKEVISGSPSDAKVAEAIEDVVPRGVPLGIANELLLNPEDQSTVKKKGTENAISYTTGADRAAKFLGAKSLEESKKRTAQRQVDLEEDKRAAKQKEAMELVLSGSKDDYQRGVDKLVELGYNQFKINKLIKTATKTQQVPEYERTIMAPTAAGRRKYEAYGGMYDR